MERGIKQTRGTRREQIYNFLVDFIKKNGYAPSVREICTGTNLSSTSSVYMHLLKLEDEGKIQVKRKSTRAIKLVGYEFIKVKR
jgi:repressor LexA